MLFSKTQDQAPFRKLPAKTFTYRNSMTENISQFILWAPPLLFALTFHEFAHGFIAHKLGDPTPAAAGRLTLNPLKHLDPLGTLAFFLVKFGWAKPVPVNPAYFQDPRRGMVWVALAGPATNFLLAIFSALLTRLLWALASVLPYSPTLEAVLVPLSAMLVASVWINMVLCVLNLLPIPPLDGGRIITGLLPESASKIFGGLERYGMILVILLMFSGLLSRIIGPIINTANSLLLR